ncbi:MAG: hypothetical protein AABY95_05635 [Pseudomonadota bacterium]
MKRLFALCLLIASGAAVAEDAKATEPAATPAPAAEPSAEQKPAEAQSTEVKSLEPVDEKKDEKAAKSADDDGGVTYSAIGISRVSTDFDNLEPAINLTFVQGIKIPTIDWIAAEIDFGVTIIPGENSNSSSGGSSGGGGLPIIGGGGGGGGTQTQQPEDLSVFNIGVFGVLKSPPEWFYGFYGKAKLGYSYVQANLEEFNENNSGTAFGGGAGWQYSRKGGVEFLYTKYSDQLDYLGFSVSYGFGGNDSD